MFELNKVSRVESVFGLYEGGYEKDMAVRNRMMEEGFAVSSGIHHTFPFKYLHTQET